MIPIQQSRTGVFIKGFTSFRMQCGMMFPVVNTAWNWMQDIITKVSITKSWSRNTQECSKTKNFLICCMKSLIAAQRQKSKIWLLFTCWKKILTRTQVFPLVITFHSIQETITFPALTIGLKKKSISSITSDIWMILLFSQKRKKNVMLWRKKLLYTSMIIWSLQSRGIGRYSQPMSVVWII